MEPSTMNVADISTQVFIFRPKLVFLKLACEMLHLSWCTINPLVQTKLLQMSQDLKIECLVKCLRRNKFIANNSSGFKWSRLLWASPLILSLRIFLQFHFRLRHFIFGSYLRPSLIMPLFFPQASYSNILAVKSEKITILSFCLGWIF
jgi:hypothetical protein